MNALIWVGGSMATLAVVAWALWPSIKGWFGDSETLFFARLQMAVGALWGALLVTDVTPFLNVLAGIDPSLGKWMPAIMVVWGVITETARRSRALDL